MFDPTITWPLKANSNTLCKLIHVQRSFREIVCSDRLKVDFWIQGPASADTSQSDSGTIVDQSESRIHDVF